MNHKQAREILLLAKQGFAGLKVNYDYQNRALSLLNQWLTDEQFTDFVPQIQYLVEQKHWDYLLDSFYQVIPFGTGGRRGEVGIGPNRINQWTIQASAQGHSQYLMKQFGEAAKQRGIVLAYDVREFNGNQYFSPDFPNPVLHLTSENLAQAAAEVYAANGIKVYIFEGFRTTPELSFAIRHLHTASGVVFSASHNPPSHNGKKIYDEFGGQLIPPDDQALVLEITDHVDEILRLDYQEAISKNLVTLISNEVDDAYITEASAVSLSGERNVSIVYTPMHGCGSTSVLKALSQLGFDIQVDPATANPSGAFENITFNIPNPEVVQSFDTALSYAKKQKADVILNSDPDADRIGVMVHHQGDWRFINGNEIAAILTAYVVQKKLNTFNGNETVIKTAVTTDLVARICQRHSVQLIGDLMVGFKYVGDAMNQLEASGHINRFLLGLEESHGYLAGNYARDKDAVTAAIWLSELAAELKLEGLTLIDYLNQIYNTYGYFRNYLTEIRMLGATGKEKIDTIQASLRSDPPKHFGRFSVASFEDCRNRLPIVSATDEAAKDVLIYKLNSDIDGQSVKVTIRPSGTEPKIKMYFEIGSPPGEDQNLESIKSDTESVVQELEKAVMLHCYQAIGVEFPERGFMLFWQLPLEDKLRYFEVESEILKLADVEDRRQRKVKLLDLLAFLGSNPVEKVNEAFMAAYDKPLLEYLDLNEPT